MQKPFEQGADTSRLGKYLSPFLEVDVGGDDRRGLLVALTDELEKQVAGPGAK